MRPQAKIDFGGDLSERLISVTVDTGLAPGVDMADVRIAAGDSVPSVGDSGTIELGYDSTTTVTAPTTGARPPAESSRMSWP